MKFLSGLLLVSVLGIILLSGCASSSAPPATTPPAIIPPVATPPATTSPSSLPATIPPVTTTSPSSTGTSFTLTANDDGFFDAIHQKVTQITVPKGQPITLTINSDSTNNSFGGQAIKSVNNNLIHDDGIAPGGTKTFTFTATESFHFQNWWQGFQVKKGEVQVTVQ